MARGLRVILGAAVAAMLLAAMLLVAAGCADDGEGGSASGDGAAAEATTTQPATDCDPARPVDPGSTRETIEVDGLEREYALHVPESYDGTTPAPLILNLHGFTSNIEQQDSLTQLPQLGGERGYIVVTPQGYPISIPGGVPGGEQAQEFEGTPFWNFFGSSGVEFGDGSTIPGIDPGQLGVDDVAFFDSLLDSLEADLCVDADRVYATGLSNGAGMTTTLACELGDRFAAIAPVAGVNLTGACPGDDPVAVRAIHGDADDVAAYGGNSLMGFELGNPSVPDRMYQWAEHNGCEPDPQATDDGQLTVLTWDRCDEDTTVQLYTIAGWPHLWPRAATPDVSGVIDASVVVLDFFDEHTRQ